MKGPGRALLVASCAAICLLICLVGQASAQADCPDNVNLNYCYSWNFKRALARLRKRFGESATNPDIHRPFNAVKRREQQLLWKQLRQLETRALESPVESNRLEEGQQRRQQQQQQQQQQQGSSRHRLP